MRQGNSQFLWNALFIILQFLVLFLPILIFETQLNVFMDSDLVFQIRLPLALNQKSVLKLLVNIN